MADKEVRVKIIGDVSDITKKLDTLKKELKDMASTLDKASSGNSFDKTTKGLQDLQDEIQDTEKRVEELDDSLDQLDNNSGGFDKVSKGAKELNDNFGKITKSAKELDDTLDKVDSNNFNTLNRNTQETQETFKNLTDRTLPEFNRQLEKAQDTGKESNTIFDKLKNLFSGIDDIGSKFGGKLSASFEGCKNSVLETIEAFGTLSTASSLNAKKIDELRNNIKKAQTHIDDWRKKQEKLNKTIEETKEKMERIAKAQDLAESQEELEKLDKEYENLEKKLKGLENSLKMCGNAINKENKNIRDYKKELKELGATAEETIKGFDKMKQGFGDALDSFGKGDFGGALDGLKDAFSGLFEALPTGAKIAIASITGVTVALKKCYDVGVNQLKRGFETLGTVFGKIGDIAKSFGNEIKNAFENITGFEVDLSSMIEVAVDFESTMAQVGAICGATDDELVTLSNTAREWGATTRYSGTEVAEAMTYMGMAGWSTQEVIDGLGGVLNLATVGCIDLGQASDFVTDGLTALGMTANQSNDFVDMLSATIVNSNTGVAQMQSAFENVAPIAGTLGISMSDLSVAIGLMSNQGVKAEKSGTALKNLLTNMASPTDKMVECIKKYNLETAQTKIVNGDLIGGIQELKKQLDGLSASEKTAIITTIAGKEALSGVSALLNSSTSDINTLKFAVDSSTKSSRAYAQSLGLIDEEGNIVAGTFDNMVKTQKGAYDQWVNFNEIMEETTDTMTFVGGTTTDLGAIIHKLGEDGEVTAESVNDILDVFDKLADTSEKTTKALEKYGIEIKRNEDGSLDFGETLKSLGAKWDTLTDSQKKALAEQLGIQGSVEELNELFGDNGEKIEELVDSYERMKGVSEHLAESFDATLKGSILNLASAIEERLLQVFDKIKPIVQGVVDTLTTFFDIWNGFDEKLGKGFADAITWLEKESRKWGESIAKGLSEAISNIDKFINSESFDSLLKVGTNIIKGIADGITKAKEDGSLDSAIKGAINKIATWCSENLDTIIEVGKTIIDSICEGINENQDLIGEIIQKVIEMQSDIDGTVAYEKGRLFGENFGKFIIEGLESVLTNLGQYIQGFIESFDWGKTLTSWLGNGGESWSGFEGNNGGKKNSEGVWSWLSWLGFGNGQVNEEGKKDGEDYSKGVQDGVNKNGENLSNTVNDNFKNTKPKTDQTANEIGQGISDGIMSKLETLDAQGLKDLQTELTNTQTTTQNVATAMASSFTAIQDSARTSFVGFTNIVRNQMVNASNIVKNQAVNMANSFRTEFINISNIIRNQMTSCANIVRNQCVNMSNIFRNQFVNMSNIARNQMVNVSNIIRNQATSWSNIIKNQVTNARNSLTTQMISMASVTRTQMTNCSNIIRNQATSWSNIIRNQAQNSRNALTSSFMSMASVVRTQMANCLSIVKSYMAQIKAQTSQTMTMKFKVEKSITTTNITKNVTQGMANTMASMNTNMRNVGKPNVMNTGLSSGGAMNLIGGGTNGNLALEVPLYLDGREIARASASYNQAELSKLEKRGKRKRGE